MSEYDRLEVAAYAMVHALAKEDSPPHIHEAWAELNAALTAIRLRQAVTRKAETSH